MISVRKRVKIYFYDTGVRNAIIKNFNPLSMRQDTGALWENFLVAGRLKRNEHGMHYVNSFFRRTLAQQEIDYIEEHGGSMHAFECKWRAHTRIIFPSSFCTAYPGTETMIITRENLDQFLL